MMLKLNLGLLLSLLLNNLILSQDYLLNFDGKGDAEIVDSVKVENLTQHTTLIFNGKDTLNLVKYLDIQQNDQNAVSVRSKSEEGSCVLDFEIVTPDNISIELKNQVGKKILLFQKSIGKGHYQYKINGLKSGEYVFAVHSNYLSCFGQIESTFLTKGDPEINEINDFPTIEDQTGNSAKKTIAAANSTSLIKMEYQQNDLLKITGMSAYNRTVVMIVPYKSRTISFNFANCSDVDGNHYAVMQIGNQLWMTENLKTTHYQNGDTISNVTDNGKWNHLTTGAYRNYYDNERYVDLNGRLYNWFAVNDSRGLAPKGWRIPDVGEWSTMENAVMPGNKDSLLTIGNKLKEMALIPAGYCNPKGSFGNIGTEGYWWLSFENDNLTSWYTYLYYTEKGVSLSTCDKNHGFSVRCIKDLIDK